MKKPTFAFLAITLLSAVACERMLTPEQKPVYVPWEAGLTLIYEDPSLPSADRFQNRLQRRVSSFKETPQGKRVTITYSTLKSNQSFDFLTRDGSWVMMQGDTALFTMLPEGFPDRVSAWEDKARGLAFHVVGRAALQNPDLVLPEDYNRIGIWVEMEARNGVKQRIFFLPGIGETEDLVLNRDGKWVVVNQLVSRGFTDIPTASADEKNP